jgi:hypothetical protein
MLSPPFVNRVNPFDLVKKARLLINNAAELKFLEYIGIKPLGSAEMSSIS